MDPNCFFLPKDLLFPRENIHVQPQTRDLPALCRRLNPLQMVSTGPLRFSAARVTIITDGSVLTTRFRDARTRLRESPFQFTNRPGLLISKPSPFVGS